MASLPEPRLSARVADSAGPRWWRTLAIVGLLPLAALGVILPWSASLNVTAVLTGIAWLVLVRILVPRLKPRACTLAIEPGAIRVEGAGAASQRLRAADVRAASTARLASGFSVGLVRYGDDDPPLWLELESAADVDRVRRALGVGHGGFGRVAWPPRRGTFHGRRTRLDLIAAGLWLGTIAAIAVHFTELAITLGVLFVPFVIVAAAIGMSARSVRHGVCLSPSGVRTILEHQITDTPWSSVLDAEVQRDSLVIRTTTGAEIVPLPDLLPVEREHLVAQLRSAALRARGHGPLPPGIPTSLAILAPREEAARAWIERVDATAATLMDRDGYRRSGVEERDLWDTLESTDAPPPIRAAAARILARVAPEQAGPRIAQVLLQEHDEGARDCIRVALEEDVDVAAGAMDRSASR